MKLLPAALALCASAWAISAHSADIADVPVSSLSNSISLEEAVRATLQHNPQLTGYRFRSQALDGERQTAALKPAFQLGADVENLLGSGDYTGIDGAELTLSLASVVEMGGQRGARLEVISARQDQLDSQQRVLTLDVLSAVTQSFIALVAAQEQLTLRQEAETLAKQTATALEQQVNAGRSGEAELLRAQAAQATATVAVAKARRQVDRERLQLSRFWADATPDFDSASAELFTFPTLLPLPQLREQLASNPDLALLANEVQLRQAQRIHAEAQGKSTVEWNAGVRRFEASDDAGVVVGLSVPLGSEQRNRGAVAAARAEEAGAQYQQDSARVQLDAQLEADYQAYTQAAEEAEGLRSRVLPLLEKASNATLEAFRQGRHGYLEVSMAQRELLETRAALIDAAVRVHQTRIAIERITGA